MRFSKSAFLLIILSLLLVTSAASYSGELSPAIDIIKNKTKFIKSGTVQSDVIFSAEDFDKGFGIKVDKVTVKTLPPVKDGILKLAGTAVASGQEIPREKLGMLKFVPNAKNASQTDFIVFHSSNESTELKCTVTLGEGINFSPSAYEAAFSTLRNVILCKTLQAFDPEDDELQFEIVSAPKNGVLTLTNAANGNFEYFPKENFCGNDSFEYRVKDSFGNTSDVEKVTVKVEKPLSDIYFSDMTKHWAHNAAIKTATKGFIPLSYSSEGYAVFNPDQTVTREEFLVSAMKAVGYKVDSEIFSTFFIDDDEISDSAKCYVSAAYRDNIIGGYATPTGMVFDPDGEITRAQAAVILSKLINAPSSDTAAVFADSESIPTWAYDAMNSLVSCGIMSGMDGNVNASDRLTKAQCAQLLCSAEEYQEQQQKKNGFFSRLFGKKD